MKALFIPLFLILVGEMLRRIFMFLLKFPVHKHVAKKWAPILIILACACQVKTFMMFVSIEEGKAGSIVWAYGFPIMALYSYYIRKLCNLTFQPRFPEIVLSMLIQLVTLFWVFALLSGKILTRCRL